MRLIYTLFFLGIFSAAQAQAPFEGVITWSMTISGTDAKAISIKQLSPKEEEELKAGIAEMEKQMNDPNMQEAFKANPSLKATIEQRIIMMKAMQGSDGMSGIIPKGFTIKIKDGNTLTKIDGGLTAAMGDILYVKATDKTYYIKNSAKTYSLQPAAKTPAQQQETTKVTATTETKKILSYNCTKYSITTTKGTSVQTTYVWATKEIKDLDSKSFQTIGSHKNATSDAVKSIDGVPLRIEVTEQGQSVVLEVTAITKQTLAASDFAIPADYKEVPLGQ